MMLIDQMCHIKRVTFHTYLKQTSAFFCAALDTLRALCAYFQPQKERPPFLKCHAAGSLKRKLNVCRIFFPFEELDEVNDLQHIVVDRAPNVGRNSFRFWAILVVNLGTFRDKLSA